MKQIYFTKKLKYLINLLILSTLIPSSFQLNAQSEPFNCDYSAYLFQYADVYAIDLASGRSYLVAEEIVSGKINATAYNPTDGYIWGYRSEPSKSITRIGKDFATETYTIPELTTGNKYVGAINSKGIYYFRSGSATYYSIDLNPSSDNYLKYLGAQNLPQKISIHDWAFNAVDNKLYSVEKNTNKLYRITPETGAMEDLGVVPILAGLNYTYGAVYFDASGNFYVSANQSGSVYIINEVQNVAQGNMKSNIFAYGPASASNDGARCPTAPVPQEDCSNGKDDDGDGLADCDDPACSGISECPVTYTASSANSGGLESNDRLAEQIGRRNYMRAKEGYEFNSASAKRVKKNASYMKKGTTAKNNISLSALTPLGVIDESEIIESSAADLLDLTNASDIYSVDYLKDNASVAALMVIKTENQVYEHSKFICDRFLGAELLSVSSIQLREQNFIKSIIKQPNGELEFALTFSARLNTNNQFVIESHWNIDAYKKDALYYNFQIWANSIDDLLLLGEEVLSLLEVNSPIDGYAASPPPPVFVKSARYQNGKVLLNLVNNNDSKNVRMEGGMKKTETSATENIELTTVVNGYLQTISVDTGNLFDLGFRISAGLGDTPDDLFVADAPWGLDDSSNGTVVETYEVLPTEGPYMGDGYPIERNISLKGTTENYLGVYRALSPRFSAVDLSDYDKLGFEASGTGVLEVKLLKGNGESFSTVVTLTIEEQEFNLKNNVFKDQDGNETDFSDIKALVFNLVAKNSYAEEKSMDLSNIDFNNKAEVSKFVDADTDKAIINPNPLVTTSTLYFYEDQAGEYTFELFNLAGRRLNGHHLEGDSFSGQNTITIDRKSLPPGLYFYSLKSSTDKTWSGRLMIK
ncbi:T9SS type A sorting domain-containing protein [Maribacter algarum]|uniref:T9SS type A sorting domain-containing protein n=1 Tax=Maribacter algarum (ex Zhang et al. 2020) TaxID=2578118 RepID=A0A5S3PHJ0_9FLAO|nr:T9SS type A sorting domain-containing protein [Maribacter algarum]TMM53728.1 T9SS type A sorting domain-containing protein [Maribacter algarum]